MSSAWKRHAKSAESLEPFGQLLHVLGEVAKALARIKHKGYRTLIKEFVSERLYEKRRSGKGYCEWRSAFSGRQEANG